jgi:hypothetical protein
MFQVVSISECAQQNECNNYLSKNDSYLKIKFNNIIVKRFVEIKLVEGINLIEVSEPIFADYRDMLAWSVLDEARIKVANIQKEYSDYIINSDGLERLDESLNLQFMISFQSQNIFYSIDHTTSMIYFERGIYEVGLKLNDTNISKNVNVSISESIHFSFLTVTSSLIKYN